MLEESPHYFHTAAKELGLSDKIRDTILTPKRVFKVDLVTQQYRWELDRGNAELLRIMRRACYAVRDLALRHTREEIAL